MYSVSDRVSKVRVNVVTYFKGIVTFFGRITFHTDAGNTSARTSGR